MSETKELTTNVYSCARCGNDHENIIFKPFTSSPVEDTDGTIWTHWALCPTTGEPVLLKVIDDGEEE